MQALCEATHRNRNFARHPDEGEIDGDGVPSYLPERWLRMEWNTN
jgi:hypothetical protein